MVGEIAMNLGISPFFKLPHQDGYFRQNRWFRICFLRVVRFPDFNEIDQGGKSAGSLKEDLLNIMRRRSDGRADTAVNYNCLRSIEEGAFTAYYNWL